MKKKETSNKRRFMLNLSLVVVFFFTLLLMSGIHQGFLVLVMKLGINQYVQTFVPIVIGQL